MEITIMSREGIEKLSLTPFPAKTAIISIIDSDAPPVGFHNRPEFLLSLAFDDAEPESDLLNELLKAYPGFRNDYRIITDQQAKEIANFAHVMHKAADLLICQCEFGQSRSAAVAAAITEYFNGDGIGIFADDRYCPNKYVFRKVLEKLKETR